MGERTPKSHWSISLESIGVFHQGYGVVLEPDQEAWESGGNKIPILNHMAVGFWVPEIHVICLSQPNLKIRENPAIPPKQIICWSWTNLSRLMAKQHFCNNYWDKKTSVQRTGNCTASNRQPTEVTVELKLLLTVSHSVSFRTHWFLTSSNSCISLDSRLVLTLGCFK